MVLDLSSIWFTDQDDIVPEYGYGEQILNGYFVDTYAGNDKITGTGREGETYGFKNEGTLNTDDGDDIITGTLLYNRHSNTRGGFSIINFGTLNTGEGNDLIDGGGSFGYTVFSGIYTPGTLNAGGGDDTLTGRGPEDGIVVETGTLNMGEGNDLINAYVNYGIGLSLGYGGTIDTGNGDDSIIITQGAFNNGGEVFLGESNDSIVSYGNLNNFKTIETGNGNDSIVSYGNLDNFKTIEAGDGNDIITSYSTFNDGVINTGNGNDSIDYGNLDNFKTIETGDGNDIITSYSTSNDGVITTGNGNDSLLYAYFVNRGNVFLGEGNDSIAASTELYSGSLENFGFMGTGEGNDTITSTGVIYNEDVIETGNGDDSIIVDGGTEDITGTRYGIYNNRGAINMGDGNDSIIANEGFQSGPNSGGAWFLGEGDDYIKGYGSGDFYGGNGNDTLELTPGTYTVGIWGEGWDTSAIFTKGDQLMITSEFEKLKAGSTIYDFTSLTAGQIIIVA
jgi:hypothetical protein